VLVESLNQDRQLIALGFGQVVLPNIASMMIGIVSLRV
jgi:hypothetical protein